MFNSHERRFDLNIEKILEGWEICHAARNAMRWLTFISLVLLVAASCPSSSASGTIRPSRKVQTTIDPILEAALAVQRHDVKATEFELGKRLGRVFEDQSATGDESLVVLLGFYIGEANSGDVVHQITLRGKRMLPLLAKYKDKTVMLEQGARFAKLRMPLEIRRQDFATAMKFIRQGKVWGID